FLIPFLPTRQTSPSKPGPGVGTCCLYFAAPQPPSPEAILYLNGEGGQQQGREEGGEGAAPLLVNNCCFPSTVAPSYAPPGQTLVSVSTIGTQPHLPDPQLEAAVRQQLGDWFGGRQVATWRHLRTYRIPFAQPNQVRQGGGKRGNI
ncbi:hypothetical protein Agub_g687, partial [Astrephomene gubernaculifera]